MKTHVNLSRRERQIMDIVYRRTKASAMEVLEDLPDPPSYSAVRALMRILEEKGHLKHGKKGARYIYQATWGRRGASKVAVKRILDTFFEGSAESVVAMLLEVAASRLTKDELSRIGKLVDKAKSSCRK